MKTFDLAIAYKWKYDNEFIQLIEKNFHNTGLRTFVIGKFNVEETIKLIKSKKILFKAFLDRASDEDLDFLPLSKLLKNRKCYIINPYNIVHKSEDKCRMHKKLYEKKFQLPRTISFHPFNANSNFNIEEKDLDRIGRPFIIKPATFTGGGEGVVHDAESFMQIQIERMKNPGIKYLVQQKIQPGLINERRAWFRILYAFGKVMPAWWDDLTHIYFKVSEEEIEKYNLLQLYKISKRLAKITRLDYFSTEIALTKDHRFVLIDYVNDQCDMRLKSLHPDGVPDEIVIDLIESMKSKIKSL